MIIIVEQPYDSFGVEKPVPKPAGFQKFSFKSNFAHRGWPYKVHMI